MLAAEPYAQINLAAANTNTVQSGSTVATAQGQVVNATVAGNQVQLASFDVEAAEQAAAMTSKVFTKVTYEWVESDYRPHLGLMGELEISTSNNNALPQWSIALIGGVAF